MTRWQWPRRRRHRHPARCGGLWRVNFRAAPVPFCIAKGRAAPAPMKPRTPADAVAPDLPHFRTSYRTCHRPQTRMDAYFPHFRTFRTCFCKGRRLRVTDACPQRPHRCHPARWPPPATRLRPGHGVRRRKSAGPCCESLPAGAMTPKFPQIRKGHGLLALKDHDCGPVLVPLAVEAKASGKGEGVSIPGVPASNTVAEPPLAKPRNE